MKKYRFIAKFTFLTFLLASCEKQLELEPQQSLSVDEALSDFDGIKTALIGAYAGLQSVSLYGRDLLVMPEASGDNLVLAIDNSGRFIANANYQWTVNNGNVTGIWNALYAIILRVNTVINNIAGIPGGTASERDQVLGEALFIRALAHFELVRGFAQPISIGGTTSLGVPYVKESVIGEPGRDTVGEVYADIVGDLLSSINLLTNDLIPFRGSREAGRALLSRVYLYMENDVSAVFQATEVINSARFNLISGVDTLGVSAYVESWQSDGTSEEIFSIKFLPNENLGASSLAGIYIPPPDGFGDLRPSRDIIDELSLDSGDVRRQFIRDFNGDEYQFKFPGLVSPRILRFSEVFLNRAEANAKIGNFTDAIDDLNFIRTRRGTAAKFPQNNQVLNEVLKERRRELAWEGHRTYDLFRNIMDMVRIECNAISICEVAAGSDFTIWPIPDREMKVNANMIQNDGY